ncbi:hypothetical protein WICPIJ_000533, partial [Wickerhamomyces pijperi]
MIPFIGGEKYSWLSLLSIKSLRSFGCNLPIEMVTPDANEYELEFCEELLPSLGGNCIVMEDVFGKELKTTLKFGGYQSKQLAIMASSSDEV